MKDDAEKRVRISLAVDAVSKAENVEATDEDLEAEYVKMADIYKLEVDKIKELSKSTLVVISHELDNFCHYVDSIFIVEGDVKIYENKEDFLQSENSYRHVHKH